MGRDIVLFLGAGFSKDSGLPIMSEFGPQSRKDYEGLKQHTLEDNFKNAAPMLVEAAKAFYAFQDLCKLSPTLTSKDVDNLEKVFCIAESMNESGLVNIPLQGVLFKPDVLIQKIRLWIWKVFQQCPFLDNKRKEETNEKTYTDFFQVLEQARIWERTTVITTNYDLIFEYKSSKSWKNEEICAYPLKELHGSVKVINIQGKSTPSYVYVDQDNPKARCVLCKLHGSVNYFENGSNSEDNTLYVSPNLGSGRIFWDKPAIFEIDAIWKIHQEHGYLIPAIVPPTYAKLVRKPWLRSIWHQAFDSLKDAKTIIFVGYSMPETDGFMRALIHGAFAMGKRKDIRNIFVIDPSKKVHENYIKLFGDSYRDIGFHPLKCALEKNILNDVLEVAIK